jgi:hypothetical protein
MAEAYYQSDTSALQNFRRWGKALMIEHSKPEGKLSRRDFSIAAAWLSIQPLAPIAANAAEGQELADRFNWLSTRGRMAQH